MIASVQVIKLTYSPRTLIVLLCNFAIGEGNDSHSHAGERRIVKVGTAYTYHRWIRSTATARIGYGSIKGYCSPIISNAYRECVPVTGGCSGRIRRVWFVTVFEFLCKSCYFCAP